MYSHYMNGKFAPLKQEQPGPPHKRDQAQAPSSPISSISGLLKGLAPQSFLQDLDSGDILLLLIILFLFLESDNLELVITLGILFLLGFGDTQDGL